MFKLGDEWPDWWADLVTANKVVTSNDDGSWRGGPDKARIEYGKGFKWARKGDYIARLADGTVEVIYAVKA